MSFQKSPSGMQTSLLGYYNQLPDNKRKKMEESAEAAFHSLVVSRIDESPFATLYCEDNGAPNKPIRQLVGSIILMHYKNWSTRDLFENIDFNLLTMRALGIDKVDERAFCRSTFFNFQKRVGEHYLQTGENLLEEVFDHLTAEQMEKLGIGGKIQRCDSFQAVSNIVSYTRVRLLVEVLIRLHRILDEEDQKRFGELLEPYIQEDSGHYVYELNRADIPKELQKLGEIYLKLHNELKEDYGDREIFAIFERTLEEQFTCSEKEDRIEVRPTEEIPSDALQSPDDPEATYREKNGKSYRGQAVSVTETADPEDDTNLLTDVAVAPNNRDDSHILEDRLDKITEKTPELEEFHSDGGYGNEQTDKEFEAGEVRHVMTGIRGRQREVEFDIQQEGDGYRVSCPQQSAEATKARKRWKASFDPQVCQDCPHAESCPTQELKSGRAFYFSREDFLAHKRRKNIEEIPTERRKIRPNVEATVKEFTRPFNHKGKLRYRGRFRTEVYALSMAIAINFKREMRQGRKKEGPDAPSEANRDMFSKKNSTKAGYSFALQKYIQFWAIYFVIASSFRVR